MAKRKRDVPVLFWVSAEELELIHQKMQQYGTENLSAYLRKMALDGYVVKLELPELKELVSLMRRSSYYVEPVNQEHPKYQVSRKLIVREKETEVQTEAAGSEAVTESETAGSEQQTEEAEDSEAESEITDIDADEFDDLVEQAQNQDTYDEESGLELHDVLEQAGDEGVDLEAMEEGEIATFEAVSAYSARSTQQVTIEKGPLYRYADYNLGTYLTEPYLPTGYKNRARVISSSVIKADFAITVLYVAVPNEAR